MAERATHPEIVRLTEQYPFEVISVAGSIAEHYSVSQMTDILSDDDLVQLYAEAAAEKKSHFAALHKKGYEPVRDKQVRHELARSAFHYLADVRGLWHRDMREEMRESA